MDITSIELYRVELDGLDDKLPADSIFAVLRGGNDFGLGEVSLGRSPREMSEWSGGAFACLRDWLAPALLGQHVSSGESLQKLLAPFQGNARAKSALDIAWWDLSAKRQGQPLYQRLGGAIAKCN